MYLIVTMKVIVVMVNGRQHSVEVVVITHHMCNHNTSIFSKSRPWQLSTIPQGK